MTKAKTDNPLHAVIKTVEGEINKIGASLSDEVGRDFDDQIVSRGLLPEFITALPPISLFLGYWIGHNLHIGIAMNEAIAEVDEVVGSSMDTLVRRIKEDIKIGAIEAQFGHVELTNTIMLKGAMDALAAICRPGRAVEVATLLVDMMGSAVANAPLPH